MNARQVAYQVLLEILRNPKRMGPILYHYNESFFLLPPNDRDLAEKIIKGVLEEESFFNFVFKEVVKSSHKHIIYPLKVALMIGLYQIFFLERVPDYAAINETVALVKNQISDKASRYANWFLREILRRKDKILSTLQEKTSSLLTLPQWLTNYLGQELSQNDLMDLLKADPLKNKIALRVNTLKTSREKLVRTLLKEGINARQGTYSPFSILIERSKIKEIKEDVLEAGLAQVQSEASQLAPLILNPLPGEIVLDLCSGFGTKAFGMAQMMGDQGLIISVDLDEKRLKELQSTKEKLGISIVKPIRADATLSLPFKEKFQKILLDAPCSNLGALWRRPGLINRLNPDKIEKLAEIQLVLLKNAKMLLKDGGYLLYVTCTLSKVENEFNIERFLALERDMELANPTELWKDLPKDLLNNQGFIKTIPYIHQTDGFFFALLKKRERS